MKRGGAASAKATHGLCYTYAHELYRVIAAAERSFRVKSSGIKLVAGETSSEKSYIAPSPKRPSHSLGPGLCEHVLRCALDESLSSTKDTSEGEARRSSDNIRVGLPTNLQ